VIENLEVSLALVACEHVAQERAELPHQFMPLHAGGEVREVDPV
jgi:hypothetical protein